LAPFNEGIKELRNERIGWKRLPLGGRFFLMKELGNEGMKELG